MSYLEEQIEEILWDKALDSIEDMRRKADDIKDMVDNIVENIEIDIKDTDYHPYPERYA